MAACCPPAAVALTVTKAMPIIAMRSRMEPSLATCVMRNLRSAMPRGLLLPLAHLVVPVAPRGRRVSLKRGVRRARLARQIDHPRAMQILHRLRALQIHRAPDHTGQPRALLGDDA